MREKGKVEPVVPKGTGEPEGPKQTSGKVQHARMHIAPKVENLNGMPTVH